MQQKQYKSIKSYIRGMQWEWLIQLNGNCFYQLHIEFWLKYSKFAVQELVSEKLAIYSILISQQAVKAWIIANFQVSVIWIAN